MMGWRRDLTVGYDRVLVAFAAICNVAAFATLSVYHEKEMEPPPILDDTVSAQGNVAGLV